MAIGDPSLIAQDDRVIAQDDRMAAQDDTAHDLSGPPLEHINEREIVHVGVRGSRLDQIP